MHPDHRRGSKETAIFREMMIRKFEKRAHRGNWKDDPFFIAWENLTGEIHELCDAVNRCEHFNVIDEAIDVANSCLILIDVLKGLNVKCEQCKTQMINIERKVWDDKQNFEVIDMRFMCPKCTSSEIGDVGER